MRFVRLSHGAARRHLVALLLTESLLLVLAGGLLSLVVVEWTLTAIASFLSPEAVQSMSFRVEPSLLVFLATLAMLTGFVFGLFPAMQSTRADLITAIRAGRGRSRAGTPPFDSALHWSRRRLRCRWGC